MLIYSPLCDNPESMTILDRKTMKFYTEEEARNSSPKVRSRLVNHCTKQGYKVLTLEECDRYLKERNK